MLMKLNIFLNRNGVRTVNHLEDPKIVPQYSLTVPRNMNLHLLDMSNDNMFPNRNYSYFKDVVKEKKIRIQNVIELSRKEGTSSLLNRYLDRDVRDWRSSHKKTFIIQDLWEKPITTPDNIGVYNYDTVKNLYNYTVNMYYFYNVHYNMMETYLANVKTTLEKDRINNNMIIINIPDNIPGFLLMKRYNEYTLQQLASNVDDYKQYWLFELYKWLTDELRPNSMFKRFSDKDSERIFIELKYRGYSSVISMAMLRSLSEESKLACPKKFNPEKTLKFFLRYMYHIQNTIVGLSYQDELTNSKLTADSDENIHYEVEKEGDEGDDDKEDNRPEDNGVDINDDGEINPEELDANGLTKPGKFFKATKASERNKVDDRDDPNISYIGTNGKSIFDSLDEIDDLSLSKLKDQTDTTAAKIAEKVEKGKTSSKILEVDEEKLDELEEEPTDEVPDIDTGLTDKEKDYLLKGKKLENIIEEFIETGESTNILTAADIRAIRLLEEKRKRIKDPYNGKLIDTTDSAKLDKVNIKQEVTWNDIKDIDDAFKSDKTGEFDRKYIKQVMKSDIVSSVKNLEKAGMILKDWSVEEVKSSVDRYELHRVEIKPMKGASSPIYFRIPIVDEEGTFMVSGNKYRMRKTRQDLPIRKISPTRVSLASNYGKFFVSRTDRKAYDQGAYIIDHIKKDYLGERSFISKLIPGKKKLNLALNLPTTYHLLASEYDSIETLDYALIFNKAMEREVIKEEVSNQISKKDMIFIGYEKKTNDILIMDRKGFISKFNNNTQVGEIEDLLQINRDSLPSSFSVIKVMGTDIPFVACMGYYVGLSNLIGLMDVKYKLYPSNTRVTKEFKDEKVFRFFDYKLCLHLDTEEKRLVFNGLDFYTNFIKQYKLSSFNDKDIYLNMMEFRGQGLIHLKELDCLDSLFIDPITQSVLKEINEPEDFRPLLFRANSMLKDLSYPDINDPRYSRLRGYDRMSGLMYKALSESVREHHIKGRANSRLSVDPYKVWNYITQDNSTTTRAVINPIHTVKEDEIVTLTGRDGMSTGAIKAELRRFHPNDTGVFSEATVDSSNVAVVTYLTPYTAIEDVRGIIARNQDELKETPAKAFSSPVQLTPMAEYDD